MSLLKDLRIKYNIASIAEKLIIANVIVFVAFHLLHTGFKLFKVTSIDVSEWLAFPEDIGQLATKPWTIITYAFFHSGFWHILINLIMLNFSARFFTTYFSNKRLLTVYLIGGICGALLFMFSYNFFPVFEKFSGTNLRGASAAVMAVMFVVVGYAPSVSVRLPLIGNIKFWWIALFFVVQDVMQIGALNNSGGHFAHLGGALFGYVYAVQLKKGNDIGAWFEKLMDGLVNMFKSNKKSPLKTVHKRKQSSAQSSAKRSVKNQKSPDQAKIDAILDKISKSGYESLTKQEKDLLFKAGKE